MAYKMLSRLNYTKKFFGRNFLNDKISGKNIFQQNRTVIIPSLDSSQLCFKAVQKRDPFQSEYLQAVDEVISSCGALFKKYPDYIHVLPVICEPERTIQFRVPWVDDDGHTHINRGFRVQFSQILGPYKGGLRFHKSVNKSIIKFLGFEQIFKNALTGLPMGGAKGGSDFNPKNKSNSEVLRFCQSFMSVLHEYIGPDMDVPAGDIGVGGREIGYLFGEWKRITARHQGVFTGKGVNWGGSHIRPEATGYGCIYITEMAMKERGQSFKGKRCAVSGSGNVAEFTAEKIMELGGTVVSFSDSNGTIVEPDGFTEENFAKFRELKKERKRCKDYSYLSKTCKYFEGERPWKNVENVFAAFPSATQNEIDESDAEALIKAGVKFVGEGANMPSTPQAIEIFRKNCCYLPAKAANAGGVAVSGLEMAQNSQRIVWSREEVDQKLWEIMKHIYETISLTANDLGDPENYVLGANAAGYRIVADAMFDMGQPLRSWKSVV